MSALAYDFIGNTITFADCRINLSEFPRILIEIYDVQSKQVAKYMGIAKVSRRDFGSYMLNYHPAISSSSTFFITNHTEVKVHGGMEGIMEESLTRTYL